MSGRVLRSWREAITSEAAGGTGGSAAYGAVASGAGTLSGETASLLRIY